MRGREVKLARGARGSETAGKHGYSSNGHVFDTRRRNATRSRIPEPKRKPFSSEHDQCDDPLLLKKKIQVRQSR